MIIEAIIICLLVICQCPFYVFLINFVKFNFLLFITQIYSLNIFTCICTCVMLWKQLAQFYFCTDFFGVYISLKFQQTFISLFLILIYVHTILYCSSFSSSTIYVYRHQLVQDMFFGVFVFFSVHSCYELCSSPLILPFKKPVLNLKDHTGFFFFRFFFYLPHLFILQ